METIKSKKGNLSKIISFRITEEESEKLKMLILKKQINKSDAMRKIIADSFNQ